jgi:hypothetical protein
MFPEDPLKNNPISRQRAYQIVSDLGKRLEIPRHITPSWFRFQREHYLIQKKGFSPYDVQAYLKLHHPPKILGFGED